MPFPVSRRPLVLITILIAVLTTLCGNAQNLTIQIVPGGNATLTWNASLTGAVEVVARDGTGITLNTALHAN
jgi:hypothetical protein